MTGPRPTKACKKCGSWEKNKARNCRPCSNAHARRWRKKRGKRTANPEVRKRYQQNNRDKVTARRAVLIAIRKGTLKPWPVCQVCWEPRPVEAHHPDYSKKIDVIWLCRACHIIVHGGVYAGF